MTIVFQGSEQRVENIEACATCTTVSSTEGQCPADVPFGRFELAAGTYDVVVKTTDATDVRPDRGTWTLDAGSEYEACYVIVSP